jgi:hypothetical protein
LLWMTCWTRNLLIPAWSSRETLVGPCCDLIVWQVRKFAPKVMQVSWMQRRDLMIFAPPIMRQV